MRLPAAAVAVALWATCSGTWGAQPGPTQPGQAGGVAARLECFTQPDGVQAFALSLKPGGESTVGAHDVVVLFDTSASQIGAYQAKAMAALEAMLAGLGDNDRVELVATDLQAIPLSRGFVAPRGAEMTAALEKLKLRTPLGTTDMEQALTTASAAFAADAANARVVIYIGKGTSTANLLDAAKFAQLTKTLVEGRIALSSFAVGVNVDLQLLGALAARSGGVLLTDGPQLAGPQAGQQLAAAARGTVLWPTSVTWPAAVREAFPKSAPPLRSDRESVVIGTLQGEGPLEVQMDVAGPGGPRQLSWSVPACRPDKRNSYLARLVELARVDGGVSLPLVDALSLAAARDDVNISVVNLDELAREALATGNLQGAERLSGAALRLNPADKQAAVVQVALAQRRAGGAAAETAPADAPPAGAASAERAAIDAGDLNLGGAAAPPEGAFAESVRHEKDLIRSMVQSDVVNEVNKARSQMATDPELATQNLKLLLERVRQVPELQADVRDRLTDTIQEALREAARRTVEAEQRRQQRNEALAAAKERMVLNDNLLRQQQKLQQLMARFDSLMDEGKYSLAEEQVASVAEKLVSPLVPDDPVPAQATVDARQTYAAYEAMRLRVARQKGVVDTLATVEQSHIPFPDDVPIVYPPAEQWKDLTTRRKEKYSSVDLAKRGAAERKIDAALKSPTQLEFVETPLQDVIQYLKDYHGIEIQFDKKAMDEVAVGTDTPITKNLKGVTLRSALRLMLGELDLTYVIEDEVLKITTKDNADAKLATKVYPVADLVLPVQSMGGGMMGGMMGGMGGGMMGGGMGGGMMGGGMGGGMMGGMGGGMGGMGGGMGGMGGGMGMMNLPLDILPKHIPPGGFQAFAVADDLTISSPAAQQSAQTPQVERTPQSVDRAVRQPAAPQSEKAAQAGDKAAAISLEIPSGITADAYWEKYFAAHEPAPAAVREAVRTLRQDRKFDQIVALVQAALRHGQGQPWMYDIMVLALQAGDHPKAEIERAVMSAADFAQNPLDLMYLGAYLTRVGLDARALQVFRQVARLVPAQGEPYVHGLQAAQRLNDLAGIQWATVGILSQAWPKSQAEVWQSGMRAARAALAKLKQEKRTEEAKQFEAALDAALVRDCVAVVTWTGEADVDLLVEEPSGTVCSLRNSRTTGGGILVGDASTATADGSSDVHSEAYVCPQGFDGTYRVLLRRVWGKLTAGKVTVDVYTHYHDASASRQSKKIPLDKDEALVVFELKGGRRQQPLEEQQVANAAAGELAVNRQVLAQQIGALNDPQAIENFFMSRQAISSGTDGTNPLLFGFNPFALHGAVGYQPVIQQYPEGATMSMATAVISADRRYVRFNPGMLTFSGIAQVNTFNYATGQQTNNVGGGTGGQGFSGTFANQGGGSGTTGSGLF